MQDHLERFHARDRDHEVEKIRPRRWEEERRETEEGRHALSSPTAEQNEIKEVSQSLLQGLESLQVEWRSREEVAEQQLYRARGLMRSVMGRRLERRKAGRFVPELRFECDRKHIEGIEKVVGGGGRERKKTRR